MTRVRNLKQRSPNRNINMEDDVIPLSNRLLSHSKEESLLATKFHWSRADRPKWLAALMCACSCLYTTRIIMPLCMVLVAEELNWDKRESGLVLSSFFWGYLITQIPGGFLSDVYGAEKLVMWAIIGCSVTTMVIPIVTSSALSILSFASPLALVVAVRVCLGCSQGIFYPATYSIIGKCLPISERSSGGALALAGGPLGSLIMGSLGSLMLVHLGWRMVFIIFGLAGLVWTLVWYYYFLNQNPAVIDMSSSIREKSVLSKHHKTDTIVPWGVLMWEPAVWAVVLVHFCHNCMYFNLISWLPTYFHENFPQAKGWIFNVLPYIANLVGKIVGGKVADKMIQKGFSVSFTRKCLETVGTSVSSLILLTSSYATGFWQALFCMSLTLGLSALTTSGSLCNIQDLSPTFAGSISGVVFCVGAIPGILGVYATGYILHLTNSWKAVFQLTSLICISGNLVYIMLGKGKKIA
ncbi:solute carrier family 17 member 9-like [Actinia tenebrosa]|uniref:Solute carrier family 17 member 9-like n=1 Tax=Actinia tenebrosa TaxID=6105 RepID=A0A6P8J334_ACTTE|nr:solute carrier family 17 member 9-like [Actinia tenebrosa]